MADTSKQTRSISSKQIQEELLLILPEYLQKLFREESLLQEDLQKDPNKITNIELNVISEAVTIELEYFRDTLRKSKHRLKVIPARDELAKFLRLIFNEHVKDRLVYKIFDNKSALVKYTAKSNAIKKLLKIYKQKEEYKDSCLGALNM